MISPTLSIRIIGRYPKGYLPEPSKCLHALPTDMVAAMPHNVAKTTSKRNLTTNDLRSVAIGLAAAVAIVMLASAMASDSGSASAGVLEDSSEKSFISITNGQSANIQENSAATTTVMTVATDTTPTGCGISSGNADGDGDGNKYEYSVLGVF